MDRTAQRLWLVARFWAFDLLLAGILQPDRDQTSRAALWCCWIVPFAAFMCRLGLAWYAAISVDQSRTSPHPRRSTA